MVLTDLLFLVSVLVVMILSGSIVVSSLRGRFHSTRRWARLLGLFVAAYAAILILVALARPRQFYAPGERRCFDDWCLTALSATVADISNQGPCLSEPGVRSWVVSVEVSSVAMRIRQRARDARAELEDQQGKRYQPCAGTLQNGSAPGRSLNDELGPGESFRVSLPFRLPDQAKPAGLVVHHGDFPGIAIIGADQSFLHAPALLRMEPSDRK